MLRLEVVNVNCGVYIHRVVHHDLNQALYSSQAVLNIKNMSPIDMLSVHRYMLGIIVS